MTTVYSSNKVINALYLSSETFFLVKLLLAYCH